MWMADMESSVDILFDKVLSTKSDFCAIYYELYDLSAAYTVCIAHILIFFFIYFSHDCFSIEFPQSSV